MRSLATRFGAEAVGEAMIDRVEAGMLEARDVAEAGPAPRALFLLGTDGASALAAGRDTAADAMLGHAGAENVFGDVAGYEPVNAEAIASAAPDVIVVVAHGEADAGILEAALALPGVAATPAGRARGVVVADALRLLGFGPRAGEAARDLARALRDPEEPPAPDAGAG